jgi:hypothetical protein
MECGFFSKEMRRVRLLAMRKGDSSERGRVGGRIFSKTSEIIQKQELRHPQDWKQGVCHGKGNFVRSLVTGTLLHRREATLAAHPEAAHAFPAGG